MSRVIAKDTEEKRVCLSDGETTFWLDYETSDAYEECLGWDEAPDEKVARKGIQAQQSLALRSNSKNGGENHCSGVDMEAPYDLWAEYSLNQVKGFLAMRFQHDVVERRVAYQTIEKFLEAAVHGRGEAVSFPSMSVGMLSQVLMCMSLYLGNSEHAGYQISKGLGLSE